MVSLLLRLSLLIASLATSFSAMTTRTTVLKRTIEGLYRPHRKHAALFTGEFQPNWVHPDMLEIVEHFGKKLATPLLKQELEGVYSFNAFSPEFVTLLTQEIENFYQMSARHKIPIRRPNSMNNYGIVVNEIGLRPLISAFQQDYLWPLCRQLFPKEASQFDDHHSFIVRYQAEEDLGLDMHTDDSDVTFNVCLGEPGFTESTLTFCGMFGAPDHRQSSHVYHHEIGRAILHSGSRRHGADDIASGRRINLIVWSHNSQWRASEEYKEGRRGGYQAEASEPSEVCLSYTHDVDYFAYKELPQRATNLQLHPWCPPPGLGYPGFEERMRAPVKKTAKERPGKDPLDSEL